jgi:hypothetical protein
MIVIPETLIRLRPPDPAAETEMIRGFIDAGFTVLDPILYAEFRYSEEFMKAITNTSLAQAIGRRFAVHVVIIGEAFAETRFRDGRIFVSRARVEARAVKTETGLILGVVSDQRVRQANDIIVSIGGITVGNFDRTVMGQLARDMLKDLAEKIVPYVLYSPPDASYFDIITARNGDREGSTVLNPSFTIASSLGQFTIPTSDIKTIVLGDTARITRPNGSTLSGQLKDTSLIVSDLGAIPMSQVAIVVFAIK